MGILNRSTPVERALADLDKARETVARWQTEQSTKAAELADLEARIGDEVLADETAVQRLTGDVTRLRAEIDVAARTADAASSRVVDAGRAVLRAYAAELKGEADELRAQAERRQAKTDKLLAELSEWEGGARYVPYVPSPAEVEGAGMAGIRYRTPKTHRLKSEADGFAHRSALFEQHAAGTPDQVAQWVASVTQLVGRPADMTDKTSAPVTVTVAG